MVTYLRQKQNTPFINIGLENSGIRSQQNTLRKKTKMVYPFLSRNFSTHRSFPYVVAENDNRDRFIHKQMTDVNATDQTNQLGSY